MSQVPIAPPGLDPRFVMPDAGSPAVVTFPPITRGALDNGLKVWTIPHDALPLSAIGLMVDVGSVNDPDSQPGLVSMTADLLDERAGARDAIGVAEAWAGLGATLETETDSDVTMFGTLALSRLLEPTLALLAEIVTTADFTDADVERVRDLRVSRLRQLRNSASTIANRAFLRAVFGAHGYGHGSMGTIASVGDIGPADARACHAREFRPDRVTLIVAGDVPHDRVMAAAAASFGSWPAVEMVARPARVVVQAVSPRIWLIDRPGAPQSELRVGHLGAARSVPDYHALVALNGVLGGQFSSRLNQRLRQEKGYTYGAHSAFDMRRASGAFMCDTSVQSDATSAAIRDILDECAAIGSVRPPAGDELLRVKEGMTRGYAKNFETAAQLARAASQLVMHGLPDDTFDRFVPSMLAVDDGSALAAARAHIRPEAISVVVVGDAGAVASSLAGLGMDVVTPATEF
jgi:zinc protease